MTSTSEISSFRMAPPPAAFYEQEGPMSQSNYAALLKTLCIVLFALVAFLPEDVSAGQSSQLTPQAQSLFRAGAASLKSGDFPGAIAAFQEFLELNDQLSSGAER